MLIPHPELKLSMGSDPSVDAFLSGKLIATVIASRSTIESIEFQTPRVRKKRAPYPNNFLSTYVLASRSAAAPR
jgi:hypothetical protein